MTLVLLLWSWFGWNSQGDLGGRPVPGVDGAESHSAAVFTTARPTLSSVQPAAMFAFAAAEPAVTPEPRPTTNARRGAG